MIPPSSSARKEVGRHRWLWGLLMVWHMESPWGTLFKGRLSKGKKGEEVVIFHLKHSCSNLFWVCHTYWHCCDQPFFSHWSLDIASNPSRPQPSGLFFNWVNYKDFTWMIMSFHSWKQHICHASLLNCEVTLRDTDKVCMAASKVVDRMAKTKMKTKKRTKSPKGEEQSRHPAACGRITILETCVFSAWSILAIAGKMEEVAAYLSGHFLQLG